MTKITYVYSSASVEALENLFKEFIDLFNLTYTIEDLFYYGVFCKASTYALYEWGTELNSIDVPKILTDDFSNKYDKFNYVNSIISQILRKEIDKPEWMQWIEENAVCSSTMDMPSTFLFIEPKSEEYINLAKKLIEFLYSVNNSITIYEERTSKA